MKFPLLRLVIILFNVGPLVCVATADDPKLFPITEFGKDWPQGGVKGGFIDQTGAILMKPSADIMPPHHLDNSGYFAEGLEPIQVQLKTKWPPLVWGYMDTKFNFIIEPQFEGAEPFSEGLAAVRVKKQPWSFGYIDHTGNFVVQPRFEEAHPFSEGLAQVVNASHLMGFIDPKGNWVIQPQYLVRSGESNFSEGLSCVGKKVPPAGAQQSATQSSQFIWGYIDKTGAQIIDFQFKEATAFHEGLAAVETSQGYGYIDKTGAYSIPTQFALAWPFSESLARVQTKDGKMSYINKKGDVVFTLDKLTWADPFSEGLADAALSGGPGKRIYGYIDHTGNFVIKPQFQHAAPFVQGLAQVLLNGEAGYIDRSGNFMWKIKAPALPR
jgi:hypothetical protein